jgi:hypothetical protein
VRCGAAHRIRAVSDQPVSNRGDLKFEIAHGSKNSTDSFCSDTALAATRAISISIASSRTAAHARYGADQSEMRGVAKGAGKRPMLLLRSHGSVSLTADCVHAGRLAP